MEKHPNGISVYLLAVAINAMMMATQYHLPQYLPRWKRDHLVE
jgi:hypothetical protein